MLQNYRFRLEFIKSHLWNECYHSCLDSRSELTGDGTCDPISNTEPIKHNFNENPSPPTKVSLGGNKSSSVSSISSSSSSAKSILENKENDLESESAMKEKTNESNENISNEEIDQTNRDDTSVLVENESCPLVECNVNDAEVKEDDVIDKNVEVIDKDDEEISESATQISVEATEVSSSPDEE